MRGQKLIGFRNFNSSWYRQKETLPLRWNVKKFSELFWSESDCWLSIHSRIRDQILGHERTDRKDTLPLPFSFLSLLFDPLFIFPISATPKETGRCWRKKSCSPASSSHCHPRYEHRNLLSNVWSYHLGPVYHSKEKQFSTLCSSGWWKNKIIES